VHKVKVVGPDRTEHEFKAPEDTYNLEAKENAGVELPFSRLLLHLRGHDVIRRGGPVRGLVLG
jgi:hypothetical protein